jgi:hypothetical protein
MGKIEKKEDAFLYRQDNGQITARFSSIAEKKVLAHEGRPAYKKVFYLLVLAGALYLAFIFISY